jgi:hypothetical protein
MKSWEYLLKDAKNENGKPLTAFEKLDGYYREWHKECQEWKEKNISTKSE